MGLGAILTLVYLGSISVYHTSLLVPTIAMLNKIKKDGYVSTKKDMLSNVVYNKVFTSCIAFDGDQTIWSMFALIPGINTILALISTIMVIRNRDRYSKYEDLVIRGFIKKKDDDDKNDKNGKKQYKAVENKNSSKDNNSIKKMTRSEVIEALKAERDKLSSKDSNSKNKVMVK